MNYIIDRFEGDMAVCEDDQRNTVNIPKVMLPDDAKAGDVIRLKGHSYEIDLEETSERKKRIQKKMDELFN